MTETLDTNYASFGRRFCAFLLDALIIAIPLAVGGHLVPIFGGILVMFLYAPILECSPLQATIGKHLMGIQVVDLQGRRISFQAALIRNVVKVFSTGILFIGYLFALFTEKHQALHDLLADTLVVYGRNDTQPIVDAWSTTVKDVFQGAKSTVAGGLGGDALTNLERLQNLRERGAITEDEFQTQKRKILGEPS
jgi:uncharacterized RDD family membrane protein YckC